MRGREELTHKDMDERRLLHGAFEVDFGILVSDSVADQPRAGVVQVGGENVASSTRDVNSRRLAEQGIKCRTPCWVLEVVAGAVDRLVSIRVAAGRR